jgi:hypothetical protein
MARNSRKSASTRTRFTQKLDKSPEQVTIERRVHMPNGQTLAIARVNGVYLLARFDKNEAPLQSAPDVYGGADGQTRAYVVATALAGRPVSPPNWLR